MPLKSFASLWLFYLPLFLIVYVKLEDEPHLFRDVIWENLHDTRSNKWVLNYV